MKSSAPDRNKFAVVFWGFRSPLAELGLNRFRLLTDSPLLDANTRYYKINEIELPGGEFFGRKIESVSLKIDRKENWETLLYHRDYPWQQLREIVSLNKSSLKSTLSCLSECDHAALVLNPENTLLFAGIIEFFQELNKYQETISCWIPLTAPDVDDTSFLLISKKFSQLAILKEYEQFLSRTGNGSMRTYLISLPIALRGDFSSGDHLLTTLQNHLFFEPYLKKKKKRITKSGTLSTCGAAVLFDGDDNRTLNIERGFHYFLSTLFQVEPTGTQNEWGWSEFHWIKRPSSINRIEALEAYLNEKVYQGGGFNYVIESTVRECQRELVNGEALNEKMINAFFLREESDLLDFLLSNLSLSLQEFLPCKSEELEERIKCLAAESRMKEAEILRIINRILVRTIFVIDRLKSARIAEPDYPFNTATYMNQVLLHQNHSGTIEEFWREGMKGFLLADSDEKSAWQNLYDSVLPYCKIGIESHIKLKSLSQLTERFDLEEKQIRNLHFQKNLNSSQYQYLNQQLDEITQKNYIAELKRMERQADYQTEILTSKDSESFYFSNLQFTAPSAVFYNNKSVPLENANEPFLLYRETNSLSLGDFRVLNQLAVKIASHDIEIENAHHLPLFLLESMPRHRGHFLSLLLGVIDEVIDKIRRNGWKLRNGTIIHKNDREESLMRYMERTLAKIQSEKDINKPTTSIKNSMRKEIIEYLQNQKERPFLAKFLNNHNFKSFSENNQHNSISLAKSRMHL